MTTAFHAPPQKRRKTLQEASLLEGPMLLLKSIRGVSSNRAMTWRACMSAFRNGDRVRTS